MTLDAPSQPNISRRRTLLAFVAPLAIAIVLLGASSAFAITRDTVLSRAQRRIDAPVPYSQTKYYAGYRTDCSGYVSMCWATGTSWNTRTFYKVTHPIAATDLKPGDAMLKKGYHIRLFYGWLDDAHTEYIAYESAYGVVAGTRIHSLAEDLRFGYVPVRYDRISSSPTPRNVLKNPTFDTWAKRWSGSAEEPVWWQVTGEPWEATYAHRKDAYRTARNSLELFNSSQDLAQVSELSQSVKIVPGAAYRASAYAKTASDPASVELGLTYLNALDEVVAEKRLAGNVAGIDNTGFKRLTVLETAPVDAVAARVSIRLGAGSTLTDLGPVPGSSVVIDDVSLQRPQITVSIKTSRSTAYNGKTAYLTGTVMPTSAIGMPATVYVKRPGSSWTKFATTTIASSGGSAVWRSKYTFSRSMPRGLYRFKTTVPAVPGYLGASSNYAYVRLY